MNLYFEKEGHTMKVTYKGRTKKKQSLFQEHKYVQISPRPKG